MKIQKFMLVLSTFLLALGVTLGAVGAHALKSVLSEQALATFDTGVRYLLVHAATMLSLSFQAHVIQSKIGLRSLTLFLLLNLIGILFFCSGCMMYAITGIKLFAHLAPIGGISFIAAWLLLSFKFFRKF
jgi:uncharacterized membrane protein YgdD (TMEM256/DUF423 family)